LLWFVWHRALGPFAHLIHCLFSLEQESAFLFRIPTKPRANESNQVQWIFFAASLALKYFEMSGEVSLRTILSPHPRKAWALHDYGLE
jgi:hypothetical protein